MKVTTVKDDGSLWGELGEDNLIMILEPISRTGAKALLEVRLGPEEGRYYFRDGKMVNAWSTHLLENESAYELISWRNGSFRITKGKETSEENVDIAWTDFLRFYREEIEGIIKGHAIKIYRELFFELRNIRNEQVYEFCNSEGLMTTMESFKPVYQSRVAQIHKHILSSPDKVYMKTSGRYVLYILYLKELKLFAISIFTDPSKAEEYKSWLIDEFEPQALGLVSRALEKADKKNIQGVILAVDDSPIVLEMIKASLEDYRFSVVTAEDGYEALVKIRDVRPDLIFLDVFMPKMLGYEVLKRLKEDPDLKNIPVVMLTSQEMKEGAKKAFEIGANMYLEKPFTPKRLVHIIESIMGKRF